MLPAGAGNDEAYRAGSLS